MANATERQIRIVIDTSDFTTPGVDINGIAPSFPSGTPVRWDFLFTYQGNVIQIPYPGSTVIMVVLAASRTGSAYYVSSAITTFDNTVTQASWDAGTNQHFTIRTAGSDLPLPASTGGTEYFMFLTGTVDENSTDYTPNAWGWCRLMALLTGYPVNGPVIGQGNIIPASTSYSSGGSYTLTTVANEFYIWYQGANDTNLVNGTQTITTNGTIFQAQGTTCTLNGTDSDPITAVVAPAQTIPASMIVGLINAAIAGVATPLRGSVNVSSGVEEFTVNITSLGLSGAPGTIIPHLIKPATGGDNLQAILQNGWSSTSFTVQLTGVTQTTGYVLEYIIIP